MLVELVATEEPMSHQQEEVQDDPRVVSRAGLFEGGGKEGFVLRTKRLRGRLRSEITRC